MDYEISVRYLNVGFHAGGYDKFVPLWTVIAVTITREPWSVVAKLGQVVSTPSLIDPLSSRIAQQFRPIDKRTIISRARVRNACLKKKNLPSFIYICIVRFFTRVSLVERF